MARRWTTAEDRLLIAMYRSGVPRSAIAQRLDRSADALDARRRHLREPRRTRRPSDWTNREDAFVRAATDARLPAAEIAVRLHRSTETIRRRRNSLGLARPMSRWYLPDEDRALADALTGYGSLAELASRLGRSEDALRLRADSLGLIETRRRRRWTPIEDRLLRHGYAGGLSTKDIRRMHLPGRTEGAIIARAHLLGLAVHARRWTLAEERELRRLVTEGVPTRIIARMLGRSEEAIQIRCRRRGLPSPPVSPVSRRRRWTAGEDDVLRSRPDDRISTLCALLERSPAAVRCRRRQLRLPRRERGQHHPLAGTEPTRGWQRLIARELPLSPSRALSLSRRLGVPLTDIHRIAGRVAVQNTR